MKEMPEKEAIQAGWLRDEVSRWLAAADPADRKALFLASGETANTKSINESVSSLPRSFYLSDIDHPLSPVRHALL